MITTDYKEFSTNLSKYLDDIEMNKEVLLVKRKDSEGTIMLSLKEYNSLMETIHLLSTDANREDLKQSIHQADTNQRIKFNLATKSFEE